MKTEAWCFLVSRNRYLDYRTVVAPNFLIDAESGNLLADAVYGDLTKPGEAICREICKSKVGDLTLVFRVVNPAAREIGLEEDGLLVDQHPRPILFLEGIVLRGEISKAVSIGKNVLEEVHTQLLEPYSSFWNCSKFDRPIPSESFDLETEVNPSDALIIQSMEAYVVTTESPGEKEKTKTFKEDFSDLEEKVKTVEKVESLKAEAESFQQQRSPNRKWKFITQFPVASEVSSIAFSPCEDIIACRTHDQKVSIWSLREKRQIDTVSGQWTTWGIPGSVAFSPDGQIIASSLIETGQDIVSLWKWNRNTAQYTDKRDIHLSQLNLSNKAGKVIFSPDGQFLICGSQDKSIQLWDVSSLTRYRKELDDLKSRKISSFAITPDSGFIVGGCEDGRILIWRQKSRARVGILAEHKQTVNSVAFSPDGRTFASGSDDRRVMLWDASNPRKCKLIRVLGEHSRPVNSVAFSSDGQILASGSDDHSIKLWDISSQREIQTLSGHSGSVNSVAFSHDGQTLASGSSDRYIIIWHQSI